MTSTEPKILTIDMGLVIKGVELTVRVEYEEPRRIRVDNGGFRVRQGIVGFNRATFHTEAPIYDIVGAWSIRRGYFVPVSVALEHAIDNKINREVK
jgi:hypothetical protein